MPELITAEFAPIESLRDRALGILRQATVSGEIKAGEIYSATALAKRLGVSVSPVREAMLTLVNEGIMVAVRNRGFQVSPMSEHDRAEVYELRMLLEVPSVARLATMDVTEHLPAIRQLLDQMNVLVEQDDVSEFLRADRDFHLRLLGITGNERLTNFVATLRDQTRLYGMNQYAGATGRLAESSREHHAIVQAITDGDEALARDLMARHLSHIDKEWSGD